MNLAVEAPLGLRERKKLQTRRSIGSVADRLFTARGFDEVTVAEIADAANVSVKTLFAYFRTKEELAFAEGFPWSAEVIDAVSRREPEQSIADAVGSALRRLVDSNGALEFTRYYVEAGRSPAIRSRLLDLWNTFEESLAIAIGDEFPGPFGPSSARLVAAMTAAIIRSLASGEVIEFVASKSKRKKALRSWIDAATDLAGHGLAHLPTPRLATGSEGELERLRRHRIDWT